MTYCWKLHFLKEGFRGKLVNRQFQMTTQEYIAANQNAVISKLSKLPFQDRRKEFFVCLGTILPLFGPRSNSSCKLQFY